MALMSDRWFLSFNGLYRVIRNFTPGDFTPWQLHPRYKFAPNNFIPVTSSPPTPCNGGEVVGGELCRGEVSGHRSQLNPIMVFLSRTFLQARLMVFPVKLIRPTMYQLTGQLAWISLIALNLQLMAPSWPTTGLLVLHQSFRSSKTYAPFHLTIDIFVVYIDVDNITGIYVVKSMLPT